VRTIRHLLAGYVLILLTPFLSFFAIVGVTDALFGSQNYLLPIILVTEINASIVVILIIGIALYAYGYLRREATDTEAILILPIGCLLILWGVLTYFLASGLYSNVITWSMYPGVRALTIWDHLEYWTWELKAILGVGTGLLLAATSLMEMHAARARGKSSN